MTDVPHDTTTIAVTSDGETTFAPRRERGTQRRVSGRRSRPGGSGRVLRPWLTAAGVIAAVIVVVVIADAGLSWGRIHPGVRIGPVSVGGMTPTAAARAIDTAFVAGADRAIAVTWNDTTFTVSPDAMGARLDATASVSAAMAIGRRGGLVSTVRQRVAAVFGGSEVTPTVDVDPQAADTAFDRIAAAADRPPRDASLSVDDVRVNVRGARPGRALDRVATRAAVVVAIMSDRSAVAAVIATVAPGVTDADADAARLKAVKLISGPVTVTFRGAHVAVPRETVAGWVSFTREDTATPTAPNVPSGALVVGFAPKRIAAAVTSLTEGHTRAGKDAKFVVRAGRVKVTASQVGTGPDLPTLASDLTAACLGPGARSAELRLTEAQPRLTAEAAAVMGITERISTFTTRYSTVNPSRTNNVHLLAKALDGKLVAPGAVFSFNGAAGQRTAAKGYQEAPAIVKGKLVPQLGGGVCQVGTTVFNAVFFSGLPVVERRNHSFYISHYPTGRDATVSWGAPDFKFRNDTDHWVLVHTSVTRNSLTVALYGTDPGYRVKYTTSPFTDIVKFKTVKTPDPKLAKGKTVVEDGGVDGRTVIVVRTVYKGASVVRKDTFVSHYSPKTEFVRIGTKAPSTTPTGTVKP